MKSLSSRSSCRGRTLTVVLGLLVGFFLAVMVVPHLFQSASQITLFTAANLPLEASLSPSDRYLLEVAHIGGDDPRVIKLRISARDPAEKPERTIFQQLHTLDHASAMTIPFTLEPKPRGTAIFRIEPAEQSADGEAVPVPIVFRLLALTDGKNGSLENAKSLPLFTPSALQKSSLEGQIPALRQPKRFKLAASSTGAVVTFSTFPLDQHPIATRNMIELKHTCAAAQCGPVPLEVSVYSEGRQVMRETVEIVSEASFSLDKVVPANQSGYSGCVTAFLDTRKSPNQNDAILMTNRRTHIDLPEQADAPIGSENFLNFVVEGSALDSVTYQPAGKTPFATAMDFFRSRLGKGQ